MGGVGDGDCRVGGVRVGGFRREGRWGEVFVLVCLVDFGVEL